MKTNNEELKKRLTDIEYKVTQESATERPFTGKYCDFFQSGIFNCVVCGVALFKSDHKFKTHCGWPGFSKESFKDTIEYIDDLSHGMVRVEIKCKNCGAHLGHVFEDGPTETGLRYCVNSASLDFKKN
jgi:peptide-methionine (R)-S-oxide reductase